MARILVVDDDPDIRSLLLELLGRAGYELDEASNGRDALRRLYERPPNLVILDVTMPEMDGWTTLARIRDLSNVPVLMLTARSAELERVRGLKSGADDYVTKPFGRQELLARVEALLRRAPAAVTTRETYEDDLIAIDHRSREVRVDGELVALTPLELRLLTVFVEHPNQVLSRDQLLEQAWGTERHVLPNQVKLYVGYLRRKLKGAAGRIETVRGFGYRYRPRTGSET